MASGIVEPSSQGSSQEGEKQQGPRAGERSRLVQRLLDGGSDLPAFINDLLATMAVTVAGTEAAGFLLERAGQEIALKPLAHIRQDESDAQTRSAALEAFQNLVKPCIIQGKDGAIDLGNIAGAEAEPQYCLITLLREGQEIVAVAAVITRCLNLERARQRLLSMQLVAGYFEFFTLKRGAEANKLMAQNHQSVLQLARSVGDAEGFLSAAMNLCNELANATGATRVSLGWIKGNLIRVKALSHTEEFDKKQELIVQLEKTMEECYDQENVVLHDPTGANPGDSVTRQAAVLSRAQGGHIVLSLPLRRHAEIEGVVTLEFLPTVPMNARMIESLTISVDLLAPQLYDRHENDHWLITKVGISSRKTAEELLGPKHWVAKLVTAGVILLLLVLFNFFNLPAAFPKVLGWADLRWTYKVTAPINFAAVEKRSLCAPFDGQIDQVFKLPGKPVKKGEPLFSLKTDDLVKQWSKSNSEMLYHKEKAAAYSADNTKIADQLAEEAQAKESEAQSALLQSQIDRATVVAPFDGEILKGDLTDKKDVTVKEGEEQMVFGQPSKLRAELTVNERDIQDISEGSTGTLATTSKPMDKVKFTVDRIVPLGQPKEGNNVFTVYATPVQVAPSWRPGMAGEARVDVGKRTIAWIWSHRLMEFVRLKLWM
jgi:multidrug efflux pump subunit AcrA (membrane-fusion protein)